MNHLVHISDASILLLLTDTFDIVNAWPVGRDYRSPACVIRLQAIYAEPCGAPRIEGDCYHADGLGCIRLLAWTIERRPNAGPAATLKAFSRLFSENPRDALKAPLAVWANIDAPGEQGYFVGDQRDRHPGEMDAIARLGELYRAGWMTDQAVSSSVN